MPDLSGAEASLGDFFRWPEPIGAVLKLKMKLYWIGVI